jgi:hypothetical protein
MSVRAYAVLTAPQHRSDDDGCDGVRKEILMIADICNMRRCPCAAGVHDQGVHAALRRHRRRLAPRARPGALSPPRAGRRRRSQRCAGTRAGEGVAQIAARYDALEQVESEGRIETTLFVNEWI